MGRSSLPSKRSRRSICPIRRILPSILTWTALAWEEKRQGWIAPLDGVITSSCGTRENPVLHKTELHNGIDIAAAKGTGVAAVKSGVVTRVRTSATYGKVVEYRTADGYDVMYAHLSEILVKEGEEIKQGQIIAKSGDTGLVTGPHLHYSVWKEGQLLDPLPFVTQGALL